MRNTRFAILAIVPALFFFSSCQNGNQLKIEHTNFTDEISRDQNLVFTFASDMVSDSLIGQWDTTAYVSFSPEVRGKFKWSSKNELVFSPAELFAPSTDFTASVTKEVMRFMKEKLQLPKQNKINFHTPYLNLATAQVFWAASQKNPGAIEIHFNINFNCTVQPTELSNRLHIQVNDKDVPFDVLTGNADNTIGVSIADVRGDSKETIPLKIVVDEGLPAVGSKYKTKEKLEFISEVPTKEELMVTEMTSEFIEGAGQVTVFTNQPVMNENLSTLIAVSPVIKLTAEKLDNGFTIKGDFEPGTNYVVTIKKELRGIFGYTLQEDYNQTVSFGELDPMIAFESSKGIYLSSRGSKNIGVNITAVEKVKVTVSRIYENNILDFMRDRMHYGYYDEEVDGDYEYHDYTYYNIEDYGDQVFDKTFTVSSLPKQGNLRLLNMNPGDFGLDERYRGLYVVTVQDVDKQWLQESKILSLSDIGLIARQGDDEMYVFANSILTSDPLQGVKINFVSSNNQNIGSATTDSKGVAVVKNTKQVFGKFQLGLLTCTDGDDFNFMVLDKTDVETSRFDVGGKYMNDAHLQAFIYGDREIYRPGDSIHVNTVVRTDDWKINKDLPMKIKLILPSGKEYQSFKQTLNDQGAFQTDFYLPSTIISGTFSIEVYTANDVLINNKSISVEEFVPDRIKVTNTLDQTVLHPGETLTADILAMNLFGTPATNRNYEAEMQLRKDDFYQKKYNNYNFSISTSEEIPLESVLREGKTDESGKATEKFDMPDYTDVGLLHGELFTTVFDETGRPVHQLTQFDVQTQDVFYGIKNFDYWVSTKAPLNFQFIALDPKGKAMNATAVVEVYRYRWENVIEHYGDRYSYDSQKKEQLVTRKNISLTTDGGSISFTPYNSGEYEVRIHRDGADGYVSQTFYAYGWGDTDFSSFEVSNEGEVEIQLDKEQYNVGDRAEILLKSPFDGKILVTVERNNLFDYFYVETKDKAASVTIPVKDEYLPNVFITATAIRNIGESQLPLTVARGYEPLLVQKLQNKLPVSITAVDQSRSNTKQHITVKTSPNAKLTIAVVDEGILQLKNTVTPDPYGFFYAKRALQVSSYDLYPYLFPEYSTNYNSARGGDLSDMSKRTNPFTVKRFNLVALWSGELKADGSGNASFDISIPQFSGALRIMAVAYKDDAFGSTEKTMKVADPIVISTALPRFLSPKDTVRVPVNLSNTTSKNANVTAEISVTGPMKVAGSKTQSVNINAMSEGNAEFAIVVDNAVGAGSVNVSVKGLGETFTEKIDIAVRPAATLTRVTGSDQVTGGASKSFTLAANMLPGTADAQLIISKSPIIQLSGDLRYLLQYPYGCVEQTVSAAFPQLYYRDLAAAVGQGNAAIQYNPDYNVTQAIKKLEAMQLYNGGISYWPAGDYESWWGTAYAAHFFYEAKKAGFDVNDNVLQKMLLYLQNKIKTRETEEYYFWDEHGIARKKTIASREIPYSVFVLALNGVYDQTAMNYYKSHSDLLTLDGRYTLAAAMALSGNQVSFRSLLPDAFAGEISQREFGGSFASPIRDEALALYVLLEADPDNPQVGILSKHLSQDLKSTYWLSTQDRAFAFISLGRIAKKAAQSNVTAKVMADGKEIGSFTGKDLVLGKDLAGKTITVQTSGSGTLYYFWEVNGIPADGKVIEEDKFLKVRRTYYDRFGHEMNTTFKQNDMIVVKVSVQTLNYGNDVENVAVADLLPAGFEIENPRINDVPEMDWIKDASQPDYMDIRDDRITFFTTASSSVLNFYYVVRAVSKGKFNVGPVSADAMYNGEYHSYWGATSVSVK